MKFHNQLIALSTAILVGFCSTAVADPQEEAHRLAAEAEREAAHLEAKQAELKTEVARAMAEAEAEQAKAEAAVAEAREQLAQATEEAAESTEEQERMRAVQEAEMERMYEELARVRERLSETSREVARVNREIARERVRAKTGNRFVVHTVQKPVIGVILGNMTDAGIEVIGVSPDGPAERAGIEKGDVLVAMAGQNLATGDEQQSEYNLQAAKKSLQNDEAITVTYRRNDVLVDVDVTPEVREPLAWHTVTRFPSAAIASPDEVVSVERIVVPEIDTAELAERIARIKLEVAERARLAAPPAPDSPERVYDFEFHELSELGDSALYQANVWFGLPMAQGLKLAELNSELGAYFKAERGVLVLEARDDNELQLESGDVVLKVGATEVNTPAEFMRALTEAEPGEELAIDIKRERRNKTLKAVMPERKSFGYFLGGHPLDHDFEYSYKITTD